MSQLFVFVPGRPLPQGSKRPVRNKVTGKLSVIDNNPNLKQWRYAVTAYAKEAMASVAATTIDKAVLVEVTFWLPRPKWHFSTSIEHPDRCVPRAPVYHTQAPDLDKLQRAILDGFTDARVWLDDSQVVEIDARKRWADYGQPTGADVRVQY